MGDATAFGRLFPDGMESVEVPLEGKRPLLGVEATELSRAPGARRREFAAGRACAHAALSRLGGYDGPVLRGSAGDPRWPDGVVGSITHGAGICASVVGRVGAPALGVGIDVAWHRPLHPRVARRVLRDDRCATEHGTAPGEVHWDAVVFSAKESVFKAWYPLTRLPLLFADARIIVDAASGSFDVALLPARTHAAADLWWRGRFVVVGETVRTAVTVHR